MKTQHACITRSIIDPKEREIDKKAIYYLNILEITNEENQNISHEDKKLIHMMI